MIMVNMRFNKSLILSLLIAFALTNQVYCQEEDQKEQAFKKVQSLVEFKDTVSKIDSLKQSGHKMYYPYLMSFYIANLQEFPNPLPLIFSSVVSRSKVN